MPRAVKKSSAELAEDSLVGAMLKLGWDGMDEGLLASDFHQMAMSCAFQAAHTLRLSGHSVTSTNLAVESTKTGIQLDPIILNRLLLESEATSCKDISKLSREVLRLSRLRKISQACRDALEDSSDSRSQPEALAAKLQKQLLEAADGPGSMAIDVRDSIYDVVAMSMERMRTKVKPGFTLLLPDLDEYGIRWLPGKNYVIAARPGMGKTSFALGAAFDAAQYGVVLFISAEMSHTELSYRYVSFDTGVPFDSLMNGHLTETQSKLVSECPEGVIPGRIFVDDGLGNLDKIRSRAMALKALAASRGIPFIGIVYDYIGLIAGYGVSRECSVGELSRGIKLLSKELSCTSLTLSQLNRDSVKGEDKRPQLHHLRDSGSLEQDADSVLFLHRESEYDKNAPSNESEIIVAKNRSGKKGTIYCGWSGSRTRFYSKNQELKQKW